MAAASKNFRTFAEIMADYTFSLRYDAIPAAVVTAARRHLADTPACALGAYDTVAAQAVRRYALDKGSRADATILGTARLEKMTWLVEGLAPAQTPQRLLELCNCLSTAEHLRSSLRHVMRRRRERCIYVATPDPVIAVSSETRYPVSVTAK